jgi:hypothetical protein
MVNESETRETMGRLQRREVLRLDRATEYYGSVHFVKNVETRKDKISLGS